MCATRPHSVNGDGGYAFGMSFTTPGAGSSASDAAAAGSFYSEAPSPPPPPSPPPNACIQYTNPTYLQGLRWDEYPFQSSTSKWSAGSTYAFGGAMGVPQYYSSNDVLAPTGVPELTGTSSDFTSLASATSNAAFGNRFVKVMFTGFFLARETGTYTFSFAPNTDDASFLWIGPTATQGWALENTLLNSNIFVNGNSATISLVACTYYPIRVMWGASLGSRMALSFLVTRAAYVY